MDNISQSRKVRQFLLGGCVSLAVTAATVIPLPVSAQTWKLVSPGGGGGGSGGGASCGLPWGGTLAHGGTSTGYKAEGHADCNSVKQSFVCSNGVLMGGNNPYEYVYPSCFFGCTLPWGGGLIHGQTATAYSSENRNPPQTCTQVQGTLTCNNGTVEGNPGLYQYASCTENPCLSGPPGSVCTTDNAIYIGTVGGSRIYAAPSDNASTNWKASNDGTANTQSDTDGFANTYAMNNTSHPAARSCATKAPAGTWYLPAKSELALLWDNGNRKSPPGQINLTGIGIHASDYYWSSTEYPSSHAWIQRFSDSAQNVGYKVYTRIVRCVRR